MIKLYIKIYPDKKAAILRYTIEDGHLQKKEGLNANGEWIETAEGAPHQKIDVIYLDTKWETFKSTL